MDSKAQRHALKEAGKEVPRSNEDVEAAYYAMIGEEKPVAASNEVTYVGAGENPPHMIDFMGLQKFVRGQPVEVFNPVVLEKVKRHRCFVFGRVDQDELFKQDDEARAIADKQRRDDERTQLEAEKHNKK